MNQNQGWYADDSAVQAAVGGQHPDARLHDLAAIWRSAIQDGSWAPGSRLPARRTLMAQTGAHPATIGKAMDQLEVEGYIVRTPRSGVTVAERLPHRHRVTLCFAQAPGEVGYGRFHAALARAAGPGRGARGWADVTCLHGVRWHGPGAVPAVDDARLRRVAGLIAADPLYGFNHTSLVTGSVPSIAIGALPLNGPVVGIAGDALERALNHACERGCTSFAGILGMNQANQVDRIKHERTLAAVRACGLVCEPDWLMPCTISGAAAAQWMAALLMRQARPPQALWIDDDHLAPAALAGLVDAPRRPVAIAHANLPDDEPVPVPVRRIGPDAHALIAAALERIAGSRRSPITVPLAIIDCQPGASA